uniref:(California timema) hypothetical protein n=1 Tax=Timema californicum TaxID=61474 RepID=A0A7R9J0Y0_TIMCA|nr:unnamed protein product [Timema californicum]
MLAGSTAPDPDDFHYEMLHRLSPAGQGYLLDRYNSSREPHMFLSLLKQATFISAERAMKEFRYHSCPVNSIQNTQIGDGKFVGLVKVGDGKFVGLVKVGDGKFVSLVKIGDGKFVGLFKIGDGKFVGLVKMTHEQVFNINYLNTRLTFYWIPGHARLSGNELGDQAAMEAVHLPPVARLGVISLDLQRSAMFVKQVIFSVLISAVISSRVLELSDRFLDIRKDGHWLVMFYAPWCGHCKRLEPVWAHVAQNLHNTNIRVGRVDCTRFTSLATEFSVSGFPTIMFLKGDSRHSFKGDRTLEEIVNFATRLSGPPIQTITREESLDNIKNSHSLFFIYVGEQNGPLWDTYAEVAETFQPHGFFYAVSSLLVKKHVTLMRSPTLFVFKENSYYFFEDGARSDTLDLSTLNTTMYEWINAERFATFPQVTRGNIHQLLQTKKYLVLAVVKENKLQEVTTDMIEFRDMVESVIKKNRDKFHRVYKELMGVWGGWVVHKGLQGAPGSGVYPGGSVGWLGGSQGYTRGGWVVCTLEGVGGGWVVHKRIQGVAGWFTRVYKELLGLFGWVGSPDLANSIAMTVLPLPHLLVVNSTTNHHHIPEDDPSQLTPEAITIFLEQIHNQSVPAYGGNTWLVRVYRTYFEARTSLAEMWQGNPVLTAVLFGLPMGFLSLICYSICCADIMDADEEDEGLCVAIIFVSAVLLITGVGQILIRKIVDLTQLKCKPREEGVKTNCPTGTSDVHCRSAGEVQQIHIPSTTSNWSRTTISLSSAVWYIARVAPQNIQLVSNHNLPVISGLVYRESSTLDHVTTETEGAEEMELVISVDVLRRAGVGVTIAGLSGKDPVKCSRDVIIVPDSSLEDALKKGPYDVVVLPGGLGGAKALAASAEVLSISLNARITINLRTLSGGRTDTRNDVTYGNIADVFFPWRPVKQWCKTLRVGSLLQQQEKAGRIVAAICAAPTALKSHGIGPGKRLTSYPSLKKQMLENNVYKYSEEDVVVDGQLITSRGPGTAFKFGLAIVEKLLGKEAAGPVAKGLLLEN